ncbi:MAG: hypothetical protein ABSB96_01625 [Gaiellaceae bacterium]
MSKPADSDDLRSIVDRARGVGEEKPERSASPRKPSRVLRVLIGLAMLAGGVGGFGYALVRLIHTGTCASGNTPYVIARQCPSGTGALIGLLIGALFVALIGVAVAGVGLALPGGLGFTAIGAAMLYGGATSGNAGGAVAGYTVGATFIAMGLLYLALAIWFRRGSSDDSAPRVSAVGISKLIAATAPKPLDTRKLPEGETPEKGG